ncbi:MAG: DEAD/DEAH box helicase family protein [Spirochaetales bacterium]|nr:DEAD/DEAH box helicase family protein [Spirochaetales bacterium]
MENKKSLSEEDIKTRYITPALQKSGWSLSDMSMEAKVYFTDGQINIMGNTTTRGKRLRADYLLNINNNNPIAIIEAKDNNHSVAYGLQQAMEYAKILDVTFAYSSNGDAFEEFDFITGKQRTIPLDAFPTKQELIKRYKKEVDITEEQEKAIDQPYYSSASTFSPRYYQRIAINRTLDAIARGQNRILLVMATGTGKTYTAFQIVYRLLKSGMKERVLYLADRNVLIGQTMEQDFAPIKGMHKINVAKEDVSKLKSYVVYFSLYQQLVGDNGEEDHFSQLFKKDFFDLVIVDECHRGSAKADSNWRRILEYFSSATQIGMTATPKETKYVSNIDYFGEPIYTYSLKQGIQDGFLAPFKVIRVKTDIGDGWRPYKDQRDTNGNLIEDRIYYNKDYDYNIIIEDRINQVAAEITSYLKSTDRMAKTIVFCANEDHAERMRKALVNLNSDMVKENSDYVVRITGSDDYGKSKLDYFISVSSQYPVIATTSKLLSTGVDCKMTKLIVLDECIGSMTEFKQIIGRGTRLREKEGKTSFVVMDFRNVSDLFSDPEWDGDVVQEDGFVHIDPDDCVDITPKTPKPPVNIDPTFKPVVIVDKEGCEVHIIDRIVSVYAADGKLLKSEKIEDYLKSSILNDYKTKEDFASSWAENRKEIIDKLLHIDGIDLAKMKEEDKESDVDDFDYVGHLVYGSPLKTRKEKAEEIRESNEFSSYEGKAKEVVDCLLDCYEENGVDEIEKKSVLTLDKFKKIGSAVFIQKLFGGKEGYTGLINKIKKFLFK